MTNIDNAAPTQLPSPAATPHYRRFTFYVILFLAALSARTSWGVYRLARADDPVALEFPDEIQYWQMATSLHAGDGLRDELGFRATRMPVYPALLSLTTGLPQGVVVAKCLHWFIGALVAPLIGGLAATLVGRRTGWVAGLLVAFDPFLIFFSSLLLTETLFMPIMVMLWWVAWPMIQNDPRRGSTARWAGVGLLIALAVYVRESSLGLAGALVVFILVCRRFDRRSLGGAILVAAIVAGSLFPWALRNRRVTGDWCWLTHRGGISLYDGVGPQADGSSDLGNIKQMPAVQAMGEAQWNRYFMEESIKAIRDEPARILRLAGRKLARMWNPVPNVGTYQSGFVRFVASAWSIPTFTLALAGACLLPRLRRGDGLRLVVLLLLPAMYLSALHSLFVGSVRYRLGAMPMIEILAALALVELADRLGRRSAARDHSVGD